ncbi:hypothetical protein [Hydrogenivirga sp. 128-5-R1-1]|uniref:hypothetical protein n=1 Tax=Hydrogenivirga sp. 128-5-R1-1 TaxID=392423 RepID=UPI00015F3719|nr:hypothetical protein [Hydrogenivirga sp. 128-5-R1-1]EDP76669.1 hypothetical protein HG1285_03643 [Hydrogenivirga sp. 128-5-R1-1]
MKLTVYKLMLLLPVPLSVVVGYYVSGLLASGVEERLVPTTGKELHTLPDFEFKEVEFNPEVVNVLSYIDLKPKKAEKPPAETGKEPEKPPTYVLSFTYVGERRRYAIINGMLVKEGDRLSPEEKVVRITREGVLLSGKWGKRWLRVSE